MNRNRRAPSRWIAAAAVAAALSACAAPPPAETGASAPAAVTPSPAEPQAREAAPAPAPEPKQAEPDVARLPPAAQPVAPPPRIAPVPIAEYLMGRSRDGVTVALGAPSFQRDEPPAEVWQYRGERCILDVFFMPRGDALQVAHVAIRGYGVVKVEEADCLADLAHGPPPTAPEKG